MVRMDCGVMLKLIFILYFFPSVIRIAVRRDGEKLKNKIKKKEKQNT